MESNYAFIDSQNLNLGVKAQGWELDYKRFRIYLKDKYKVKKAYLFIGYIEKYQKLYNRLESFGYELIFKKTVVTRSGAVKGNVDAELVLYASARVFSEYEKAIIVSGDGDFHCLVEYLKEKRKLGSVLVPNRRAYSSLLNDYYGYLRFIDNIRPKVEKKKGTVALSTKP